MKNCRFARVILLVFLLVISFCIPFVRGGIAQVVSFAPLRITLGFGGEETDANAGSPIQPVNGQYIAYRSDATNVIEQGTDGVSHIYLVNRTTGATTLLSASNSGTPGNGASRAPSISSVAPNGFFAVAFESEADNLPTALSDTNGFKDVFINLPQLGVTELISLGANLTPSDGESGNPSIAIIPEPDRALIAFQSSATNLVDGEFADGLNIYLATVTSPQGRDFDPATDLVIERISKPLNPQLEPDGDSISPRISGNGRFIVYVSDASNIVGGETSEVRQVYLYDNLLKSTTLVSKNALGEKADGDCSSPRVSFNGRYVTYITQADNILDDDAPSGNDALIRYDTFKDISERVNITAEGVIGNGSPVQAEPSADGRFVSFTDDSEDLVSDDTNGVQDIFVKDLLTGQLSRVNVSSTLEQANAASSDGTLSGNSFNSVSGTVLYGSSADNLVSGDNAGRADVFASGIQVPLETFTRETGIEVPADVSVTRKKLTIAMKDFAAIDLSPTASLLDRQVESVRTGRLRTNYDVRVEREGGSRLDKKKKIAKKNSTTVKKLKPGTYTVRYRVTIQKGERTVRRSAFSPPQRVRVQ